MQWTQPCWGPGPGGVGTKRGGERGDREAQPFRLAMGGAEPKVRGVLAKAWGSVYTQPPEGEGAGVKTRAGDPLS